MKISPLPLKKFHSPAIFYNNFQLNFQDYFQFTATGNERDRL